jgi:hypothetical protein
MIVPEIRDELTPAAMPSRTPGRAARSMVETEAMRLTRAP